MAMASTMTWVLLARQESCTNSSVYLNSSNCIASSRFPSLHSLHHSPIMSTRPAMSSRTSSGPSPSVPRIILAPLVRITRVFQIPTHLLTPLILHVTAALQRLDLSRDPSKTVQKIKSHKFTFSNTMPLIGMACASIYSLYMMNSILKYFIVLTWATACMLPITGQFVWPASPIFAWLVTFFCARYIPSDSRPKIHVNLLPALESVMYGANISDLQTRFTHPVLDVIAWLPYGVLHFAIPFIIAAVLWVFGPKGSIQYWGRAFGLMNLCGVVTQILLPCSAPCTFELDMPLISMRR